MELDFDKWEREMIKWDHARQEKAENDLWKKADALEKRGAIDQALQCYKQVLAIQMQLGYSGAGDISASDGVQERINALLRKQGKRSDLL